MIHNTGTSAPHGLLGSSGSSAVATWQAKTRGYELRSGQNIIGGTMGCLTRTAPLFWAVTLTVAVPFASALADEFTTINFPDAAQTFTFGINPQDDVVGYYFDSSNHHHGYLLKGVLSSKIFISIDFPGASATTASGINRRGDIVGYYVDSSGNTHGFLRRNDSDDRDDRTGKGSFSVIDFPGASQTFAFGINKRGDIVGYYVDSSGKYHGFLRSNDRDDCDDSAGKGSFTTIDVPGATGMFGTTARAINRRGDIVGYYQDSSGAFHGFLRNNDRDDDDRDDGAFTTIDVPGAAAFFGTRAFGINPQGDIVGSYADSSSFNEHGFRLSEGKFTTIDVPPSLGGNTSALGINPRGDVVGSYFDASFHGHGYLLTK